MNWINLFIVILVGTGGLLAATYELIAGRKGLPVGLYFKLNGIMAIVGGIVAFGALILSAFINPWWTIFVVFIFSWILSELIVSIFGAGSQIVSSILIVIGIVLLLIKVWI